MNKFVDLSVERDADGIYDLVIEDGDFKKTGGMDSAIFISLFTDRRAHVDEVSDPMKRRGWSGTQFTNNREGNKGSGLWLYEQRRLDQDTVEGVKIESYQALYWTINDQIVKDIQVNVIPSPADRSAELQIKMNGRNSGVTNYSYQLWAATPRKTIKK